MVLSGTPGWDDEIAAWLLTLSAAGRPPTTIALREYQLRRVARELATPPGAVTATQLVEWFGIQQWSAETRRSYRAALRGFFGWALAAGRLAADPATALPRVRPAPPCPRPTPAEAYRAALGRSDARTRLMLRLAAELGLRRGEVARAHSGDLWRDLSGWNLTVHGKGDKPRVVPVPPGLAAAIRERGIGWLFPGRDDGHLSPHHVGKLVSAALPGAWAMHSLRHRFATVAYSVDRDLVTVQELLGHASVDTTRRYVAAPAEGARRTVAAVAAI